MAQPARPVLAASDLHGTLLLRDCLEAEGGFLLVQAIKTAVTAPPAAAAQQAAPAPHRRVVLLAAAQSAAHYAAVLRKAGLQLASLTASGQLAVVVLLPLLAAAPAAPPSLRSLHSCLAAAIARGSNNGNDSSSSSSVCLVADDLTALHCLASGPAEWSAFLHSCLELGQAPGCCFVGLAHRDVPADEGWLARVEHAAALVLDVEPLESGRSADTTGRLVITRRDTRPPGDAAAEVPAAVGGRVGSRRLCYRLAEAGATYNEAA